MAVKRNACGESLRMCIDTCKKLKNTDEGHPYTYLISYRYIIDIYNRFR